MEYTFWTRDYEKKITVAVYSQRLTNAGKGREAKGPPDRGYGF